MMEEDLFSDFAILYRTLHSSRFKQKMIFLTDVFLKRTTCNRWNPVPGFEVA